VQADHREAAGQPLALSIAFGQTEHRRPQSRELAPRSERRGPRRGPRVTKRFE
jgi:hypothetical protein